MDFLCSLRDGEMKMSHKDAKMSSLKQVSHAVGCDGMTTEGNYCCCCCYRHCVRTELIIYDNP